MVTSGSRYKRIIPKASARGWRVIAFVAVVLAAGPAAAASLPSVLGDADAARYRRVFALQEDGKWKAADAEIKRLDDKRLLGHVKAQRYLHPTRYRSRFRELRLWMARYADHPQAPRIYKLALRRAPRNHKWVRPPVSGYRPVAAAAAAEPAVIGERLSKSKRGKARILSRGVRRQLYRKRPDRAEKLLYHGEFRTIRGTLAYERVRLRVAMGYFGAGKDAKALALAEASVKRKGRALPLAHWVAGIAQWRRGAVDPARRHFETLAEARGASRWDRAAGAFWAARAYLVSRQPEHVNRMLVAAAAHPHTFYGQLARRTLGLGPAFSWDPPDLSASDHAALRSEPALVRATALIQVGRRDQAGKEIRRFNPGSRGDLTRALLVLTSHLNLPDLAMRIGRQVIAAGGPANNAAQFPLPRWRPPAGYTVDRALLFAFMRQESGFNPRARSRRGARGLMQLMPRTASFIAGQRSLRGRARDRLYVPEYNIALGQRYVRHLARQEGVEDNLFYLVAAYNAGPGNLKRWRRRVRFDGDPLLFIESIPARETRTFLEKVVANFWIYRQRLGQETPSLDAVASGLWPRYVRLDERDVARGRIQVDRNRRWRSVNADPLYIH